MRILGIHDGHNGSACLMINGKIASAVQEERMVNQKNKAGMPINAIKYVLKEKPGELDYIALASNFIHEASWFDKKGRSRFRKHDLWEKNWLDHAVNRVSWPIRKNFDPYFKNRLKDRKKQISKTVRMLTGSMPEIKVIDHHQAHAASAYFGSHYSKDDKVLVLTADGSGDGISSTVKVGYDGKFDPVSKTGRAGSVGEIYSLTTHYLGFRAWEHEYKLMGMAPYSIPDSEILAGLRGLMDVDHKARFTSNINNDFAYGYLEKLYERKRFDMICASLQQWFEEIMVKWILAASDTQPISETPVNLACAGGTFMNVKGNQVISQLDEVKDMFIFPSSGDESTSIGAAMQVYASYCISHNLNPKEEIEPISNLDLGPMDRSWEILDLVNNKENIHINVIELSSRDIIEWAAEKLALGEIVARCTGRCEFGARALGNRTIMARAQQLEITDELNSSIKHRDFWMPFAPSILKEDQHKVIKNPKNLPGRWMIQAFDTTEEGYDQLKAATHPYDKTARPQLVDESNGEYYKILEMFREKSRFSGFLNTSFNLHGFPIVKDAKIALDTFLNSGLKNMIIGNYAIYKN